MNASERPYKGGVIDTPGIYSGVPMAVYHGQLTAGPSVSSSGLRTIENRSPAHYFADSYLNPDYEPDPEGEAKSHFSIGRAAATLFGGESGFREQFAVRPKEFDSWRTKEAQAWRAEQLVAGRDVLLPSDLEIIRGMAASLGKHPTIAAGILGGAVERSIVWQDEETGVWLKSRPDAIPTDGAMIVDLKTCADANPVTVRRAIVDRGYHMQLALAAEGLRVLTGRQVEDFVLVFVEKAAPFAVNIKPLAPIWLHYGERQNRRAIRKFADGVRSGVWPGYDDDEITADPPKWFVDRLESESKFDLLPGLPHDGG